MWKRVNWERDRWFLIAVLFLCVNGYGVFRLTSADGRSGPKAISFTAGEEGVVNGEQSLVWKFSTDMVPEQEVGRWRVPGPVSVVPATDGRFCWTSARQLTFQPAVPWRACTAYDARLDSDLSDVEGRPLRAPTTFAFNTQPLKVVNMAQAGFSADQRCTLRLEFNSPPVHTRLKEYVTIKDAGGKAVGFDVQTRTESHVIMLRTHAIHSDSITVALKRGLPGARGPLAVTKNSKWKVQFSRELALRRLQPASHEHDQGSISAYFSAPLDMTEIADFVSVSPQVDFSINKLSAQRASGCRITGAFQPGKSYSVTFHKGMPAANGAALADDTVRQVYFPDRSPHLDFHTTGNYLSPHGGMLIPVSSVNVAAFSVTSERIFPNNLVYFAMRESSKSRNPYMWWGRDTHQDISHIVADQGHKVTPHPNATVETRLHMRELMGKHASGGFLLTLSSEKGGSTRQLVVVTDIGLAVKRSAHDLLIWANSIRTLKSISNAAVRVYSAANQQLLEGMTDADGLAHFTGAMKSLDQVPFLVTVQQGDDMSYLKLEGTETGLAGDTGGSDYLSAGYEACVFTERGIYRPGETVHTRTVVRDRDLQSAPGAFPVTLRIIRPDGQEHRSLPGMLNELGTAEFEFSWPSYALTGLYTLEVGIPGAETPMGSTRVSVEEFVPPQIAVSVETSQARTSSNLAFAVSGRHLFGSPASGLPVKAAVEFRPVNFTHPDWPGYTFADAEKSFPVTSQKAGAGRLDPSGVGGFQMQVSRKWRPPSALRAVIGATVMESSGRSVSAYTSCMVDAYPSYVGMKTSRDGDVFRVGEQQSVELADVNPDGAPLTGERQLRVRLREVSWTSVLKRRKDNRYVYESERQLTTIEDHEVTLHDGRGEFSFTPATAGQYLLVTEDRESGSSASIKFYAGETGNRWLAWSMEKPGHIDLDLDKDVYTPGDTARLIIKTPFAGKALLTLESDRVIDTRVIEITGNTAEVTVPISAEHAPNIYCTVSLIRPVVDDAAWSAHRAVGVIPLRVVSSAAELDVVLNVPPEIRPQSSLVADIRVTDAAGHGVPVELSVAAVDEGICMLTAFKTPDPLQYFRRKRQLGVELYDLYGLLMPEIPDALLGSQSSPGGDAAMGLRGRLNPIDSRRFRPVSLWHSSVMTDSDGHASIAFDVPEFSGQLRLMVVAVGRSAFGSTDAQVTVKRPLIVRSSLPRFMAPQDTCLVPVRVFNKTGSTQSVTVVVHTEGPLSASTDDREALLADGDERQFTVNLKASRLVGAGRVEFVVEAGEERYVETFELAVRPASPRISKSGTGVSRPGESVSIALPVNWLSGTEKHSLACSGMPALTLSGGLDYLLRYPHGCLEQTTSGAFPLLYLADLVSAVRPGSMEQDETAHLVQSGVYRVLSMQTSGGGFSYWPNSDTTYKWGSIYATHFLLEAIKSGSDVPRDQMDAAVQYLQKELAASVANAAEANDADWHNAMSCRAYICHVLALAGKPAHSWMARLQEQHTQLDTSASLELAAALAAAGNRRDAGRILRGMEVAAAMATQRETRGVLDSATRNTALLLSTWLEVNPRDAAVPVIVRRLQSLQRDGNWYTTQDNAMALMALGKYARVTQFDQKPFAARVSWMAATGPDSDGFKNDKQWHFGPGQLAARRPVKIENNGPGDLYYYWRSEGIASDGKVEEGDHQLAVRREWLDIDGNPVNADRIRQGELVIVKLSLDAGQSTLSNLVIEDLLPAGLEVENPSLKTSQLVAWVKKKQDLDVQHLEARDDRVLVFVDRLAGTQSCYYAARAVTPGDYVYPAVSAECMYDPSVRSVHGMGRMVVYD